MVTVIVRSSLTAAARARAGEKNKKFFLINKKLDTIIPIEETLYFMLNQIILNGEMDINAIRIRADTLDILLYNRILGVKN